MTVKRNKRSSTGGGKDGARDDGGGVDGVDPPVGLPNIKVGGRWGGNGNFCYQNAAIQAISALPSYVAHLVANADGEAPAKEAAFVKLIQGMKEGDQLKVNRIVESFRGDVLTQPDQNEFENGFENGTQHDVNDFIR